MICDSARRADFNLTCLKNFRCCSRFSNEVCFEELDNMESSNIGMKILFTAKNGEDPFLKVEFVSDDSNIHAESVSGGGDQCPPPRHELKGEKPPRYSEVTDTPEVNIFTL